MIEARVIKIVSNQYELYYKGKIVKAKAMGKLRLGLSPIVGDFVLVEDSEHGYLIQKICERRNQLIRPRVANVDQAIIVMSLANPVFSYNLVDRLIFLAALENIEPILLISKTDLGTEEELEQVLQEYRPFGYKVFVSGRGRDTLDLEAIFKDKISVLAGQSGVGKSSLLNRINPDFDLKTQEISKALGRGKHTTRHNQLYELGGGWVADTPGFSSLDFSHVDAYLLADTVPDFKPYHGECKYRNCLHDKEPSCKIKDMVTQGKISSQRYHHYLACLAMIKEEKR